MYIFNSTPSKLAIGCVQATTTATITSQICTFDNQKSVVLHALHVHFLFLDILLPSYQRREIRVFKK